MTEKLFKPGGTIEGYLRIALQILYDENVSYIQLNNLGGMDNHCMRLAREALVMANEKLNETNSY